VRVVARRARKARHARAVRLDPIDLVVAVALARERYPVTPRGPIRERIAVGFGGQLTPLATCYVENIETAGRTVRDSKHELTAIR
jgi:hypothetical protein